MCRPSDWPNCILAETVPSGACSDDWLALAPTATVPRHAARRHGHGRSCVGIGNRAIKRSPRPAHRLRRTARLLPGARGTVNPALNAIVVWRVDQARERARAADAAL